MTQKILSVGLLLILIYSLTACTTVHDTGIPDIIKNDNYESVEGTQIKMITDNTEVLSH